VALAAFATAGIAGSEPQKTGWLSCKLAIAGIIVPFIFTYNPAMLILNANLLPIIYVTVITLIAILALAASTEGYLVTNMNWFSRALLACTGCLFIFNNYALHLAGAIILIMIILYQYKRKKAYT